MLVKAAKEENSMGDCSISTYSQKRLKFGRRYSKERQGQPEIRTNRTPYQKKLHEGQNWKV
jgi:hypothetical protein